MGLEERGRGKEDFYNLMTPGVFISSCIICQLRDMWVCGFTVRRRKGKHRSSVEETMMEK